jgi:hypothetical protein
VRSAPSQHVVYIAMPVGRRIRLSPLAMLAAADIHPSSTDSTHAAAKLQSCTALAVAATDLNPEQNPATAGDRHKTLPVPAAELYIRQRPEWGALLNHSLPVIVMLIRRACSRLVCEAQLDPAMHFVPKVRRGCPSQAIASQHLLVGIASSAAVITGAVCLAGRVSERRGWARPRAWAVLRVGAVRVPRARRGRLL